MATPATKSNEFRDPLSGADPQAAVMATLESLKGHGLQPKAVETLFVKFLASLAGIRGEAANEALRLMHTEPDLGYGHKQVQGMRQPFVANLIGPITVGNIAGEVGKDVLRLIKHTAEQFTEAWQLLERGYRPSDPEVVNRVQTVAGFGLPMARGVGFKVKEAADLFPLPGSGPAPPIPKNLVGPSTELTFDVGRGENIMSLRQYNRVATPAFQKEVNAELQKAINEGRNTIQIPLATRNPDTGNIEITRTTAQVRFQSQESARQDYQMVQDSRRNTQEMNAITNRDRGRKAPDFDQDYGEAQYLAEIANRDRAELRAENRAARQAARDEKKARIERARPQGPIEGLPPGRFPDRTTGFYSHAEEVVHNLEKEKMKRSEALALIEGSKIKEAEIRALDLDKELIGSRLATLRRDIIDRRAQVADARKEMGNMIKDPKLRDKQWADDYERLTETVELGTEYDIAARRAFKNNMDKFRRTEENITKQELTDHIEKNATQIIESPRLDEQGLQRNRYNTADPENPTMTSKTLTIDEPILQEYGNLRRQSDQLRTANDKYYDKHGQYSDELTAKKDMIDTRIEDLRTQLGPEGHFGRNHLGWYIASFHKRADGGKTMVVHQLQSDYGQAGRRKGFRNQAVFESHVREADRIGQLLDQSPVGNRFGIGHEYTKELSRMLEERGLNRDQIITIRNMISETADRLPPKTLEQGLLKLHQKAMERIQNNNYIKDKAATMQRTTHEYNQMLTAVRMPEVEKFWEAGKQHADLANAYNKSFRAMKEEESKLPFREIVGSTPAWVDPMIRRIYKDAIDQGATHVAFPSDKAVNTYNPIRGNFYEKIMPKRAASVAKEFDPAHPGVTEVNMDEIASSQAAGHLPADSGQNWSLFDLYRNKTSQGRLAAGEPPTYYEVPITPPIAEEVPKGIKLYNTGITPFGGNSDRGDAYIDPETGLLTIDIVPNRKPDLPQWVE